MYRTHSGRMVDLGAPRPEDISLPDIAHHLARVCRFGGAVDSYYSVASHCIYVSRGLAEAGYSPYVQAAGLLHDAAEAYLGDVVAGLKRSPVMAGYRALEHEWEKAIQLAFDVYWGDGETRRIVKDADLRARLSEVRDLFVETPYAREDLLGGEGGRKPYPAPVVPQTPEEAEWAYAARARELGLWRD